MEPDDREFMRQLLLRHEKATDAMIASLNSGSEESRVRTERIRADIEQIRARTHELIEDMRAHRREFVEEMRAQRQALFRILDRIDAKGA
jgi:molecular chaperone GrpE (heat shock protein)